MITKCIRIKIAKQETTKVAMNSDITYRHGCAAVCVSGSQKGKVVARGYNQSSLQGVKWLEKGRERPEYKT